MTEWTGEERRSEAIRTQERLAVVENNQEAIMKSLEKIQESQETIKAQMNKYKGFIGAITLVLSGIITFFEIFKSNIHWN